MSAPPNTPKVPAIAAEVRESITSGEYRPGHQLPSARVLAERYGAARGTVNAAMTLLIREGLVASRPRAGWFVAEAPETVEVRRVQLGTEADGPRVTERVTARPATQADADRLQTKLGSPVFEIRRETVGADGTMRSQDTVLLTAADHELVYELPAEE